MKMKTLLFLLCIFAHHFAQAQNCGGIVTDADGNALANAKVLVVQDTLETLTDANGRWQVEVSDSAKTIVFPISFVTGS